MAKEETTSLQQRSQGKSWACWLAFGLVLAGVALLDRGRDWGWLDHVGTVLGPLVVGLVLLELAAIWVIALVAWGRERREHWRRRR